MQDLSGRAGGGGVRSRNAICQDVRALGDICLDGHVCACRQSADRALPANEVLKVAGGPVCEVQAAPGFHRNWLEAGALSSSPETAAC